ncbi:apiosidase-like domain-containing protein [Dyadobacter luticola]|uniref:DUF4038 domain-containing protein n=1 Tax=Dyadobacter luticola TaxID=1979387 RepID=A0A5R9KY10_9BACT|nr:DUF4038 domain-containing protein [Dyadobacter luticola]TLV01009.1 DUF4038 domain-containing protein [Dyadobacter luticola]
MFRLSLFLSFFCSISLFVVSKSFSQTPVWGRFEKEFQSRKKYENALYNVQKFKVQFESPTGRVKTVSGFWDGENVWKARFCPDEVGKWKFTSLCSDTLNAGLHKIQGTFDCVASTNLLDIYKKGSIQHEKGSYFLSHADGTPFFFTACTAWNGTLKSTPDEWETYLTDRAKNHYNVIQFAATQWRGGDKNSEGQVAFEGSGRIKINPAYFKHLDKKIEEINRHGLVAAPVLLWALPVAEGRELSPGYYLPEPEAILLANYMVARYGGNHVIWILGGDGKYVGEYEQRWKTIGRAVFGQEHPGVVAQHPGGQSWIGKEYAGEDWLDIVGYQSGHDKRPETANWITKGPAASGWAKLPPKAFINMEPCYEDISPAIKDKEVRNASYWSVFATPVAGITYGANGIWPWLRPGEEILNHGKTGAVRSWDESIKFPGSIQIGVMHAFFDKYPWSKLKPAAELLTNQQAAPENYISIARSDDHNLIMAYMPLKTNVKIVNNLNVPYKGTWFDPATSQSKEAQLTFSKGLIEASSTKDGDMILVLERK